MRLRFERNVWLILAVSSIATAAAWTWWTFDVLGIHDAERGAYDGGLNQFTGNPNIPWKWAPGGEVKKSTDIVIVAIDDSSFLAIERHAPWRMRYGSFPYDRVLWADLFSYLKKAGAKAIVFDAVMEGSKSSNEGDIALGEAIAKEGIPLYLGFTVALCGPEEVLPHEEHPTNRACPEPAPPVVEKKVQQAPAEEDFPEDPTPEEQAKLQQEKLAELKKRAAKAYSFPVEVEGGLEISKFEPPPGATEKDGVPGPMIAIDVLQSCTLC